MSKHEKDHLDGLKDMDDCSLEELAEYYPMLGRSAKKRILEKCLEKTDESEFRNGITVSGTEIYKRPVWSRVAGIAAAFVFASAAVTGGIMLKRNCARDRYQSSVESSQSYFTTTTEKTEQLTSFSTTTEETTTTTTSIIVFVETTQYVPFTTTSATTESQTTTETTETTETTTTDVTTTVDDEETPTAETMSVVTSEELVGKWITFGDNSERIFEFYANGEGGKYNIIETGLGLGFEYSIINDVITFHFGAADTEAESGTIRRVSDDSFEIHWFDGTSDVFTRYDN